MSSKRRRRGGFILAELGGRCPRCRAGIIPNIHWVRLEFQTRLYFHADCWKKEIARQEAEIQALLDAPGDLAGPPR